MSTKATHTTEAFISPQARLDVLSSSTSQVGVKTVGTDGKVFRLVKMAANGLAGQSVQASIIDADFEGLAVAEDAIAGQNKIKVTLGSGAVTADEFEGATLVVNTGTGKGLQFYVDTHPAADAAADVELTLVEKLPIAIPDTAEVSLIANPYANAIITPIVPTGKILGVLQNDASAGEYVLIQSKGYAAVIAQGVLAAGDLLAPSASVAGAFVASATGKLGSVVQTSIATTTSGIVDLNIE